MNFGLMGTQWRGKLGILHRASFYSYACQLRPLSFRVKKESSWTCMLKYVKKYKSSLLNSSIHQHSARCIYEEKKEEKAS